MTFSSFNSLYIYMFRHIHYAEKLKERKKPMDSKPKPEPNSIPKLSLYSLPTKPSEPPGLLTPPLHTLASIPFQWEEVPGKPRSITVSTPPSKSKAARCLDLPPRLKTECRRITNMPSPNMVLDEPAKSGRFVFKTMSFRSPCKSDKGLEGVRFSSWRWGGDISGISGNIKGNFEFSRSFVCSDVKVKKNTAKVKRRSSLLKLYANNSLLGNVYERLKKVVPWKTRQVKSRSVSI